MMGYTYWKQLKKFLGLQPVWTPVEAPTKIHNWDQEEKWWKNKEWRKNLQKKKKKPSDGD